MSERRSGLAARFRRAVEKEEVARERSAEAARKAAEEARVARVELLRDLESLAGDMGFLKVERTKDGLTLRWGERYIHFAPIGDSDVRVEFEGTGDDQHLLYRQAELGHRWVYLRRRRRREDRLPLFDQGLEELLVASLGLPRPDDEADGDGTSGGSRRL